jgi:hypothetical protein
MSLYVNDIHDVDGVDWLKSNYAAYKMGKYQKRKVLDYQQFKKTYQEDPLGFKTDEELMSFLFDINMMINDYVCFFSEDTEGSIEYAKHISGIIKLVLANAKYKNKYIEEWAILQYIKLRQHYLLKLKVAYDDLNSVFGSDCYDPKVLSDFLRRYKEEEKIEEGSKAKEDREFMLAYGDKFDFLVDNFNLFEPYYAPETIDVFNYLEKTELPEIYATFANVGNKIGALGESVESSNYPSERLISLKLKEKMSEEINEIIWSLLTTYVPYSKTNTFKFDVYQGKQRLTISMGSTYEAYIVRGIEKPIDMLVTVVEREGFLFILQAEDFDNLK